MQASNQNEILALLDKNLKRIKSAKSSLSQQEAKADEIPSLKKGKWSAEEDMSLRRLIEKYGEKNWKKISQNMAGRSSIQCLHRWTKILKPGLVKGPWTSEEDQRLSEWVAKEGPQKWSRCSALIPGRSGKQCRERWMNNLDPEIKRGEWTDEEDELLFNLYKKFGSAWSKIAKHFRGRTENNIKNRFYSTIRRLTLDSSLRNGNEAFSPCDDGSSTVKIEEMSTEESIISGTKNQSPISKINYEISALQESLLRKKEESTKAEFDQKIIEAKKEPTEAKTNIILERSERPASFHTMLSEHFICFLDREQECNNHLIHLMNELDHFRRHLRGMNMEMQISRSNTIALNENLSQKKMKIY